MEKLTENLVEVFKDLIGKEVYIVEDNYIPKIQKVVIPKDHPLEFSFKTVIDPRTLDVLEVIPKVGWSDSVFNVWYANCDIYVSLSEAQDRLEILMTECLNTSEFFISNIDDLHESIKDELSSTVWLRNESLQTKFKNIRNQVSEEVSASNSKNLSEINFELEIHNTNVEAQNKILNTKLPF